MSVETTLQDVRDRSSRWHAGTLSARRSEALVHGCVCPGQWVGVWSRWQRSVGVAQQAHLADRRAVTGAALSNECVARSHEQRVAFVRRVTACVPTLRRLLLCAAVVLCLGTL
jgi:hypothetical protein